MAPKPNFSEKLEKATPSQVDIRLSWHLFKKNLRPYASITIFSVFATILAILTLTFAIVIPSIVIDPTIIENQVFMNVVTIIITVPMITILYAFFGAGYGLAFDIMTSGDEFAQFKGAFQYFKKYWWQYSLITLICGIPGIILNPTILPLNFINRLWVKILVHSIFYVISFLLYAILGIALPAITAHGNFKLSIKESIYLVKPNRKRYFKTWSIFFLLFYIPNYVVLEIYFLQLGNNIGTSTFVSILLAITAIYSLFITNPMQALVSTRIYNDLMQDGKKQDMSRINN